MRIFTVARRLEGIAARLDLSADACADPHVERLIESFAFLTARIQRQIDSEFPQFTSALLNVLYPHLLQPVPSMSVAQFVVDPEQGLVGALASCHMLTFLTIAALKRIVVDAYEDEASAETGRNPDGRMMVTRVTLRPRVRFAPGHEPDAAQLSALHDKAHANCFIANSLRCAVAIEPRPAG